MRRLLLFAGLLGLLGLSSAFAAGFTVQTEEVASFQAETSFPDQPIPLGPTVYVRGEPITPGELALEPPTKNEVERRTFVLGDAAVSVQAETDPNRYFTWQTPTAPLGGYLVEGNTTLYIEQNQSASNQLAAALFDCDAMAPVDLSDPSLCVQIGTTAYGTPGANASSNGFQARSADFGALSHTIPAGHQLRLKIVNRDNVSVEDWDLQWGFAAVAANSRLEIT